MLNFMVKIFVENKINPTWYHLSGAFITPDYLKIRKQDNPTRINLSLHVSEHKDTTKKVIRTSITYPNRLETDYHKLLLSTVPNITHSIDSSIVHSVLLNYDKPIFSIHDCFLVKLCNTEEFSKLYPGICYNTITSNDKNYVHYAFKDPKLSLFEKIVYTLLFSLKAHFHLENVMNKTQALTIITEKLNTILAAYNEYTKDSSGFTLLNLEDIKKAHLLYLNIFTK